MSGVLNNQIFIEAFSNHRELINRLNTHLTHWKSKLDNLKSKSKNNIAVMNRVLGSPENKIPMFPQLPEKNRLELTSKFEKIALNYNTKESYYTTQCHFLQVQIKEHDLILDTMGNPDDEEIEVPTPTKEKCLEITSKLQEFLEKYEDNTIRMLNEDVSIKDLNHISIDGILTRDLVMECIKFYKRVHEPKPLSLPKVRSWSLDIPDDPDELKQFNAQVRNNLRRICSSFGGSGPAKKMKTEAKTLDESGPVNKV